GSGSDLQRSPRRGHAHKACRIVPRTQSRGNRMPRSRSRPGHAALHDAAGTGANKKESRMHILSVYIPQSVIAWVIIGLIAGWLAGTVSRGRGFGCIADIILGMVGAIIGGWIFVKLGIFCGGASYTFSRH